MILRDGVLLQNHFAKHIRKVFTINIDFIVL